MEEFKKNIEKFLPFLEDLRARLFRGAILFGVVFLVGFLSTRIVLKKVLNLINIEQVTIVTSSPFQFVEVAMSFGFFLAIVVSVPYVIYSLYAFIIPALTRSEKIKLLQSIPLSAGLFIAGFLYGFFTLNYALGVLAAINTGLGVSNFWNISQFLSQIFITSALLGLVFEFPLLLTLLIRLGVVRPQSLKNKRRIAYFLMFASVTLLPPTDGISLLAMTLPLLLLYEVTIFLNNKNHYAGTWI